MPAKRHQPAPEGRTRTPKTRRGGHTDTLARAEAVCRSHGARLTPIRRRVLEALQASQRPLGAYDIAAAFGATGRRLAPISIYRALDFLIERGLVHRLASRNAFVACPHEHGPQDLVAFLICETCGGVDELPSPSLAETLSHLLSEEQFEPHFQILEIAGLCSQCRAVPR